MSFLVATSAFFHADNQKSCISFKLRNAVPIPEEIIRSNRFVSHVQQDRPEYALFSFLRVTTEQVTCDDKRTTTTKAHCVLRRILKTLNYPEIRSEPSQ